MSFADCKTEHRKCPRSVFNQIYVVVNCLLLQKVSGVASLRNYPGGVKILPVTSL